MKRLYIILLVISLLASLNCKATETEVKQESPYNAEELREIEQHQFSKLYVELEGYLEEASYRARGFQNFGWSTHLAEIGFTKLVGIDPYIEEFEQLTGINMEVAVISEDLFWDQVQVCS